MRLIVEIAQRLGLAGGIGQHTPLAQQTQPKGHRIFAGPIRQLVDEGLKDEAQRVRARRAQGPGRHAELDHRLAVFEMRHELRREFVGAHLRRVGGFAALTKGHEMIREGDESALVVEPAFEEMKARRPVKIMLHVVLAVPEQLYGRADRASRSRRPRP